MVKSNAIRCHREKNTQHKCEWERRERSNLLIRIRRCERERVRVRQCVRQCTREKTREFPQSFVYSRARKIVVTLRHVVTSRAHTHMHPWGRGPGRKTTRGGGRKKQFAHWLPSRTTIPLSPSFPPGSSPRGKDHDFIYMVHSFPTMYKYKLYYILIYIII